MSRRDRRGHVVWSSDPVVAHQPGKSTGPLGAYPSPEKQVARLSCSRRGRAGKTVVLIEGLELSSEGYQALLHDLRQALGTGGTVKDRTIEVQGDMRDRVADMLVRRGYRVKLVGG